MTTVARPLAFAALDERADEVLVPMRDGARLATDLYLPTTPGPHPTILVRLPYDKASPFAFMPLVARYANDRGFAVVVQDVRGKVRSEGETRAFVHEVDDGHDTLDWLAGRRWCNGRVGMFGDSYYGYTQWAAAASGHPALRAIVPRMTTTRVATDWMYHDGAFCLATMGDWAAHTWVDNHLYEFDWDWSVRPLGELIGRWLEGRRSRSWDEWRTAGPQAAYWREVAVPAATAARLAVPALHVGGFWDAFRRGQLADWRAARAHGAAGQHLVMDAADHFDDLVTDAERQEDPLGSDEQLAAFLPRYLDLPLRFLAAHLRGDDGRPLPPVRFHLAHAGWRDAASWPPAGVRERVLHLGDAARAPLGPEGGVLEPRPDRGRHVVRWTHRPDDLVPWLDEDPWRPLLAPADERDVEVRDDVLCFTAATRHAPLDLVGPACAELVVQADAPSLQVVAKLVDVHPQGRAVRITEGIAVLAGAGAPTPARVDLGDVAYRVRPGHRLRLEVAASCFPRYLPSFGPGADPWEALTGRPVEHALLCGGAHGSRLRLHTLANEEER